MFSQTAEGLFSAYEQLSAALLEHLIDAVPRPAEMSEGIYRRTLRARAFDVARSLLPLATHTSVGQIVSARVLERQIGRLLGSPYAELRAVGAGITSVALTAIFLLPFLAVMDKTWQYELFREQAKHPAAVTADEIARAAGATFIPYYGGASWHNLTTTFDIGMARVGSVILALAAVAALRLWRRREV